MKPGANGTNGASGNGKPKLRKTCGDFGGRKADGSPCRRPMRAGQCSRHGGHIPKTRAAQDAFLEALIACGGAICRAAKATGTTHRTTHNRWLANDPTYPERFHAAMEEANRIKVDEARACGVAARELTYQRLIKGTADTGLICFVLKNDPDVPWIDEKRLRHSGTLGLTIADAMTEIRKRREAALGN